MDEQGTTTTGRWGGEGRGMPKLGREVGVRDGTSLWLARAHSLAEHAPQSTAASIMVGRSTYRLCIVWAVRIVFVLL